MKLIENWRKAPRMLSVQAMAVAAAIQATWPLIPEDLKATLPTNIVQGVSLAILFAGIVGRLVKQEAVQPKE